MTMPKLFLSRLKSALEVACTLAVLVAAGVYIAGQVREPDRPPLGDAVVDVDGERIEAAAITKRRGTGDVALVEFMDYQCPYCARHMQEAYPKIGEELVDQGSIQHILLNFPIEQIHPSAFGASVAAECARRQGRFWEMHETLFRNQQALTSQDIQEYAEELDLDLAEFGECVRGDARDIVRADMREGERLGVRGTPAFFVGTVDPDGSVQLRRRLNGAVPFEILQLEVRNVRRDRPATNGRWKAWWIRFGLG